MRREADFDCAEELGVTKCRLERIIARAAAKGDLRTELAATRQLSRVARPGGPDPQSSGAGVDIAAARAQLEAEIAEEMAGREDRQLNITRARGPWRRGSQTSRSSPWWATGDRVKAPPLLEFVRHCLIVEKETGRLIPFELWPAQEEALAVIEARRQARHPQGPPGRHHLVGARRHALGRDLLSEPPLPHRPAVRRVRPRGDHPAAHPGRLRPDLGARPGCASWPSRRCPQRGDPGSPAGRGASCAWPTARATAPSPRPSRSPAAWRPTGVWPTSSPSGPGRPGSWRPWSRAAPACTWSRPATAPTTPSPRSMRTPLPAAAPTGRSSSPRRRPAPRRGLVSRQRRGGGRPRECPP